MSSPVIWGHVRDLGIRDGTVQDPLVILVADHLNGLHLLGSVCARVRPCRIHAAVTAQNVHTCSPDEPGQMESMKPCRSATKHARSLGLIEVLPSIRMI